MVESTRKKMEITDRRVKVAERYLRGVYQADIAKELDVDQSTISRDLTALHKEWMQTALVDINERKAEELAKVDQLEREYWGAWERSKEDAEVETIEKIGKSNGESVTPDRIKQNKRREGQSGNPAFLSGIQWCINKRCEILGLDAPKRQEVTGADGGALKLEVEYVNDPYQVTGVSSSASGDTPAAKEN